MYTPCEMSINRSAGRLLKLCSGRVSLILILQS